MARFAGVRFRDAGKVYYFSTARVNGLEVGEHVVVDTARGQEVGRVVSLLEDAPKDAAICAQEAFGPVAVLSPFRDFDAALAEVNDSVFGLQAGVFTRDLYKAHRAWDVLEVGGVVIGDVPSWRVDHMPYGGVKDSGLGREGIRFAIEDMTEIRLLVVRTPEAG